MYQAQKPRDIPGNEKFTHSKGGSIQHIAICPPMVNYNNFHLYLLICISKHTTFYFILSMQFYIHIHVYFNLL
jgi:hypothetical protein